MVRYLAASLILSSSCASVTCRTRQGWTLTLEDGKAPERGWSCKEFQAAADAIIYAFESSPVKDSRFADAHKRVGGHQVTLRDAEAWQADTLDGGMNVAGLTPCFMNMSWVGRADAWNSSMAHELAHQVQYCNPTQNLPDPDGKWSDDTGSHSRWRENGIYDAIDHANALIWDFYFVAEGHERE